MKRIFLTLLTFSLIALLTACATAPHKTIKEIRRGMSKADVLAKLGSPQQTERYRGTDIWVYTLYPGQPHKTSAIRFKGSKVISVQLSTRRVNPNPRHPPGSYEKYKRDLKKHRKKKLRQLSRVISQDFKTFVSKFHILNPNSEFCTQIHSVRFEAL